MFTTFGTRFIFNCIKKSNAAKCFFDTCKTVIAQCCQKLDVILVNKLIEELKLSKNVFYKKCGPKLMFFDEMFF